MQTRVKHKTAPEQDTSIEQTSAKRLSLNLSGWRIKQTIVNYWMVELSACACSLLALMAIYMLLYHYNGRPQPDWPYHITINSVVSWFATIIKALILVPVTACLSQANWMHFHRRPYALKDFLVYDSASRGPKGALQLLWNFELCYIASIGAVITVLTVAVDPTVQQMVTILSDQRSSPNSAYLGRTQYFLPAKHDDFSPTSEMIGSIYTGLFVNAQSENTTATSLDMNPSCPTGNCTFSPFQSLAVCSTCEDVSHSLRKTCHHDDLRPYCHFSLPNGLGMNKTLVDDWNGVLVTGGSLNQDSMRTQYSHALFNFSRIKGWYPDTALPSPKSISTNVNATQCVLYWCANTYEARVRNGGFSEDVKASWYNDKIEWQVDKGSHDSVMEFVQSSATVIISNDPMMNSKYRVSNFTSDQLTQYLASKLTSSNSIACWPPAKDSTDCRPAQKSEDLFDVLRDSKMDSLFANLAKSMTRSIRSVDPNRQIDLWRAKYFGAPDPREFEPAYGTATYTRTCISVRWWWLTFPAALILLTTTLLILTMIKTTRQDVAVWKSSPLPLLCTRLDGDTREHLRNAKGIVEMERLTQEIRARLTDDSGGGMGARLVESD